MPAPEELTIALLASLTIVSACAGARSGSAPLSDDGRATMDGALASPLHPTDGAAERDSGLADAPKQAVASTAARAPSDGGASRVDYPINTQTPEEVDDSVDDLLASLTLEASAVVSCTVVNLDDLHEEDSIRTLYDAHCTVTHTLRGPIKPGPLRFIKQADRHSPMPTPGTEIVVYLKRATPPTFAKTKIRWVVVDTGLFYSTRSLRRKLHLPERN